MTAPAALTALGRKRPSDRWTPARHQWLERLVYGPACRQHTVVGAHCEALGWTEHVANDPLGRDRLTDAGRAKLAEWRAAGLVPGGTYA